MKISKVKGKNLYYCYVKKPDGKYKKVYGKTKKEVNERAESLFIDIKTGKFVEDSNMTFEEWATVWLDNYLINVSPNTQIAYRSMMKNRIIPHFGQQKLQKITHNSIQVFINSLINEISSKFISNIYLVLHRCLRDARNNGYISSNPADNTILPKVVKKEMSVLNTQEISEFLTIAYRDEPLYADCFEFLLQTGLRISEFIGLTIDSYNPATRELTIDKQYNRNIKKFTPPKHDKMRIIVLGDRAHEIIMNRINRVEKLMKHPNFNPHKLIFLSEKYQIISDGTIRRVFKRIAEKINRPELRLHDLRHTYTTTALFSGGNLESISRSLGHSSVNFTMNKYAHSTREMNIDTAQKVDAYFKNISKLDTGVISD